VNDIHLNGEKGERYSTNVVHLIEPERVNSSAERVNAETEKGEQLVHPNHKEPSKNHQTVKLPPELSTVPEFKTTWMEFSSYRRKKKAPLTHSAANTILKRLSLRPEKSVELLSYVMERGWQTFEEGWVKGTRFELNTSGPGSLECRP
jgi:hypothetical protein